MTLAQLRSISPEYTSQKKVNAVCSPHRLSHNQKQCLAAIVRYRNHYRRSPTYRQIAVLMGLSPNSKSTAHRYVMELEAKGYVRTPFDGSWRAIEVLRAA